MGWLTLGAGGPSFESLHSSIGHLALLASVVEVIGRVILREGSLADVVMLVVCCVSSCSHSACHMLFLTGGFSLCRIPFTFTSYHR